ncbi:MAG TPA: glycoside hydrolase family 95 protein, partial [Armatimonadota bacterium]|nr:glycoside hydrolase family 95 protein [Armatimonadota bacterium]
MSTILQLGTPAGEWLEGLPLGNGRLGAMLFGGEAHERIALNHENLWRGALRGKTTVPVHQHLAEIRRLFFAGAWQQAADMAVKHMGDPNFQRVEPYQTAGDLLLDFPGHDHVDAYRRSLDLSTGIAKVTYQANGVTFHRELFVSAVHGVYVLRLTTDTPGSLTTTV